jgi:hypothetical protein
MDKKFVEWLTLEIQKELRNVPFDILKRAKTDDNTNDIVFQSVFRKLCFNTKGKLVIKAFKKALASVDTQS